MNVHCIVSLISMIWRNKLHISLLVLLIPFLMSGCFRYSFTGVSIPPEVRTVYIPFFADQSSSGIGDLAEQLNDALVERFINRSRLQITSDREGADAVIDGTITSYQNRPFSVGGQQTAQLNRVSISVRASFQFSTEPSPEWDKNFTGTFEFDPREDPVNGELEAAFEAMLQIADNMFNDALGGW